MKLKDPKKIIFLAFLLLFGSSFYVCRTPKANAELILLEPDTYSTDYRLTINSSDESGTTGDFGSLVSKTITFGIVLAAILAVAEIVVGGLEYIASAGNPTSKEKGKNRITQALLGLLIAILSYAILYTINPDILNMGLGLQKIEIKAVPKTDTTNTKTYQTTQDSAADCATKCAPLASTYNPSVKSCYCQGQAPAEEAAKYKNCWCDAKECFIDQSKCPLFFGTANCFQRQVPIDTECK